MKPVYTEILYLYALLKHLGQTSYELLCYFIIIMNDNH